MGIILLKKNSNYFDIILFLFANFPRAVLLRSVLNMIVDILFTIIMLSNTNYIGHIRTL